MSVMHILENAIYRPSVRFALSLSLIFLVAFRWIGVSNIELLLVIDLVLGFIGAFTAYYLLRQKRSFSIDILTWIIVILIIYRTFQIPFSALMPISAEVALDGIFLIISLFIIQNDIQTHEDSITIWIASIVASAILFSIVDILSAYIWYRDWFTAIGTISQFPPVGFRSPGSFLLHPNLLAGYLNIAIPFLFIVLLTHAKRSYRLLALPAIGALFITLYFTSSRGAWLSSVVGISISIGLCYIPIIANREKLKRKIQDIRQKPKPYIISTFVLAAFAIIVLLIFYSQATQTQHAPLFQSRQRIWSTAFAVFKISPISGNGPGSVRPLYADLAEIPPGFSAGHAHNLFLQLGGEMGIIGILMGLAVLVLAAKTFFQSWKHSNKKSRLWLAGSVGALASLFMHNQFDYLFEALPNVLGLFILLMIISNNKHSASKKKQLPANYLNLILLTLFTPMFLYHLSQNKPANSFSKGIIEARDNNWSEARSIICELSEKNASFTHYAYQCGYAFAEEMYQSSDKQELPRIIDNVEQALEQDDYWPMHRSLLANLLWLSGQQELGISEMTLAWQSAPRNADMVINLGWMHETIGNREDATKFYKIALDLDPWLRLSTFFDQTALRREIRDQDLLTRVHESPFTEVWQGWIAMQDGFLEKAEFNFRTAITYSAFNYHAYTGLAYVLAEQGELIDSKYYFESALLFSNHRPLTLHKLAQTANLLGDYDQADELMDQAFAASRWKSSSRDHLASTYRRPVLPSDRTPFMPHADFTSEMIADFARYADALEAEGQIKYANRIRRWIAAEQSISLPEDGLE